MHGGVPPYSRMTILPGRNTAYSHRHAANNSVAITPPGWIASILYRHAAIEPIGVSVAILSYLCDKVFEEPDRRAPDGGEYSCPRRPRGQSPRSRSWPPRRPRSMSATSRPAGGGMKDGPSRTRMAIPRPG